MSKTIKKIDLVILGGGPAGLTSAIYSARAKLSMILLENGIVGGQVRKSYIVENYPGIRSIDGAELANNMQEQAEKLGAVIDEFDSVNNVFLSDNKKIIETDNYIYETKTVIIATGATPRKLSVPSEEKFFGRGIHYCAVCDGAMYENKIVGVVGGGNSALEEAMFLTKFAKKVYLIRRKDYFNGEKSLVDVVSENNKIEILYNYDLVDVKGSKFVESSIIKNTKTGEVKEINLSGIFGYIGTEPKTYEFKEYINLNSKGYIITDENMCTNISGVYAVGDVREKEYRQITTAVSDGTIAALEAERYILSRKDI